MQSYLESKLKRRENKRWMVSIWAEKGMFKVTEQRLVDRVNAIKRRKWMSEL